MHSNQWKSAFTRPGWPVKRANITSSILQDNQVLSLPSSCAENNQLIPIRQLLVICVVPFMPSMSCELRSYWLSLSPNQGQESYSFNWCRFAWRAELELGERREERLQPHSCDCTSRITRTSGGVHSWTILRKHRENMRLIEVLVF